MKARAFWVESPGRGAIREVEIPAPKGGEVLVRTLTSGISRGTERLVFEGRVPRALHGVMRAPFQEGDFPGPLKYGYANVGRVLEGPDELRDQVVFCLYPHQSAYVVEAAVVTAVPEAVPPSRAVLAANMETAVNALWDAEPGVGDRVTVIGAGVVGLLTASLIAPIPGVELEVVDVDEERAAVAEALGLRLVSPEDASPERDLVLHASGSADGLSTALGLCAFEATVVELSWYGEGPVPAPLGEAFHPRRLRLVSSQVGHVATSRRARRTHAERMALALSLLADDRYDALLGGVTPLADLPARMPTLLSGRSLCPRVTYE